LGSYEVGNGINAIYAKNNYAYIASPNDEELRILNIDNPSYPNLVGGFSTGSRNGKSLQLVGNRLYLGRAKDISADKDFNILNNKNPASVLIEIGGTNTLSSSVNDIIVRSNLGFFLTNSDLKIFDIGDPTSVDPINIGNAIATLPLSASGSNTEPSMDCEGNYLYITSNDSSGRGYLSIVTSGNL